jgi:hypothetical protein
MPVNVRPSWIEVQVDGRENDIATGPRARDGSLSAKLYLRVNGEVTHVLDVYCLATSDKKQVKLIVDMVTDHGPHTVVAETFDQ